MQSQASPLLHRMFEQQDFEMLDVARTSSEEKEKEIRIREHNIGDDGCITADKMMFEHENASDNTSTTISPHGTTNEFLEEPTRLLRPLIGFGPAGKPRRYFRAFWKGISKRALALQERQSAKLADIDKSV